MMLPNGATQLPPGRGSLLPPNTVLWIWGEAGRGVAKHPGAHIVPVMGAEGRRYLAA